MYSLDSLRSAGFTTRVVHGVTIVQGMLGRLDEDVFDRLRRAKVCPEDVQAIRLRGDRYAIYLASTARVIYFAATLSPFEGRSYQELVRLVVDGSGSVVFLGGDPNAGFVMSQERSKHFFNGMTAFFRGDSDGRSFSFFARFAPNRLTWSNDGRFWRQSSRLCLGPGPGNVYVFVDPTSGEIFTMDQALTCAAVNNSACWQFRGRVTKPWSLDPLSWSLDPMGDKVGIKVLTVTGHGVLVLLGNEPQIETAAPIVPPPRSAPVQLVPRTTSPKSRPALLKGVAAKRQEDPARQPPRRASGTRLTAVHTID